MARKPTPTIRRWELGQRLRQLREDAGVTPKAAAAVCEVSLSTLSKIETGKQQIRTLYVRALASLYGTDDVVLGELLATAGEANRSEWYVALASRAPKWFRQYLGYEAAATEIRTYSVELVDGRMQTEDYARAVALANQPDASERDLDGYVALRRGRQARLTGDDPPRLHVVMNQLALVSNTGGPDVMRGQIERLLELVELDHVTLQVLPFGSGAHPAMTSPFTMLGFDEMPDMATVYIENGRGAVYLDTKTDLDQYGWKFQQLADLALSPQDTRQLLTTVATDL
jgi:transcriptional regulator with XRE-family HTH domain